eukprot:8161583-Alexandrium_andersonii.AAC.1
MGKLLFFVAHVLVSAVFKTLSAALLFRVRLSRFSTEWLRTLGQLRKLAPQPGRAFSKSEGDGNW